MFLKIKEGFVLLVVFMIVGCATTEPPGKPFSQIVKPSADRDHALVYIYRVGHNNLVTMGFVGIYINNEFVFNVAENGFTWIKVDPGLYRFKASWPWSSRPKSVQMQVNDPITLPVDSRDKFLSIELGAGKTYFINYRMRQDMVYTDHSERYQVLAVVASMDSEGEYEALPKLEACGLQENEYSH